VARNWWKSESNFAFSITGVNSSIELRQASVTSFSIEVARRDDVPLVGMEVLFSSNILSTMLSRLNFSLAMDDSQQGLGAGSKILKAMKVCSHLRLREAYLLVSSAICP
jgi:hypothetical protein